MDPNDPKIIGDTDKSETLTEEQEDTTEDKAADEEAIDDDVIDGSPSMVLQMAREEAELLLDEANAKAETIMEEAKQEGYNLGYNEGLEAAQAELSARMAELNERAAAMEADYELQLRSAEPAIADVVRRLVGGMVGHFSTNPDLILFLVKTALAETSAYGHYIIRVSEMDYDTVVENQVAISEGLSDKIQLEILKDSTLEAGDCFVETDLGIVDGSLKVRLEGLNKELRLIADSLRQDGDE